MELDDFKKTTYDPAPAGQNIEATLKKKNMDAFIEELKTTDQKERKKVVLFIIIFCMFVAVYSSQVALRQNALREGYALLILGFTLALGYTFWNFLRYKKVNYSEPATIFLKKAAKRYRFMSPADLVLTMPILALFIAGGFIIVHESFARYMDSTLIPEIIYCSIIAAAVMIGFWAGHKQWKREKGALLDEINKRLHEFEG